MKRVEEGGIILPFLFLFADPDDTFNIMLFNFSFPYFDLSYRFLHRQIDKFMPLRLVDDYGS